MRFAIIFLLSYTPVFTQDAPPSMSYLNDLEKQVVLEINRARRDPKTYAAYVKELLPLFNGTIIERPNEPGLMTNEGPSAVKECYDFLMKASPIDTMIPSKGLSSAASDHVKDQGRTKKTGHTGSDGSSPFDRIERYGQWQQTAGENIDYGNNVARRIVLSLIIDDGVATRGHRKNIFNAEYKRIGVACGPHGEYRHMCVMDLAGGFQKKGAIQTRGGDSDN